MQGEGQQCSRCSLCLPCQHSGVSKPSQAHPEALHRPPWALRLHSTPQVRGSTSLPLHSRQGKKRRGQEEDPTHGWGPIHPSLVLSSLLPCPRRPQHLAWAPTGQLGSRIAYPKDGVPGGKPDIHQGVLPSTPYAIISSTCPVLTFSHCVPNMGAPPLPRRAPPLTVGPADLSGCPGPSSPRPLMGAPLWAWPPVFSPAFCSPESWVLGPVLP